MSFKRIHFLDTSKGLFIILMTISHIGLVKVNGLNKFNYEWLFLVKMPGFYLVSGYLMFNSIGKKDFMKKKWGGIWKPYICVLFLIAPLIIFLNYSFDFFDFVNLLLGINDHYLGNSGLDINPTWFIINLPLAFLFCKIILENITKRKFLWPVIVLFLLIAFNFLWRFEYRLPFYLSLTIYPVIYLIAGYLLRFLSINFCSYTVLVISGFFYIFMRSIYPINELYLNIAHNHYGNFIVTFPTSVMGVVFFISLLSKITFKPLVWFLTVCSNNSLYILIFHVPIWQLIERNYASMPNDFFPLALLNLGVIVLSVIIGVFLKRIDYKGYFFSNRK